MYVEKSCHINLILSTFLSITLVLVSLVLANYCIVVPGHGGGKVFLSLSTLFIHHTILTNLHL